MTEENRRWVRTALLLALTAAIVTALSFLVVAQGNHQVVAFFNDGRWRCGSVFVPSDGPGCDAKLRHQLWIMDGSFGLGLLVLVGAAAGCVAFATGRRLSRTFLVSGIVVAVVLTWVYHGVWSTQITAASHS